MNRRDVQEALHANVTKNVPGKWVECSSRGYSDFEGSIPSVIKELMANGLRVWIYR
jgi:serine carboxypeptidase-like clade 2